MDFDRAVSGFLAGQRPDALYNSSGGVVARDATGKSGTHVAQEFDTYTWYELTALNIGVGFARIHPGNSWPRHQSAPYNYPYFVINFKDYGRGEK